MNRKFAMFGAVALALSAAACTADEPQDDTDVVVTTPEDNTETDTATVVEETETVNAE